MEQIAPAVDLETRRMELRGIVRLAGEVVAQYWPMRTFVHHNPFHSLEYLHFDETVRRGRKFLGGHGYLSGDTYRGYLRSGRIRLHHLDEALQPLARAQSVTVGPCRIAHREVLRACLSHGLCAIADEPLDALLDHRPNEELVNALADHLAPALSASTVEERIAAVVREDQAALGRYLTLSNWCDRTLGTPIVTLVNSELVKWCEAFLDEGHAAWPMPGREQGFYAAWKSLGALERSVCGIKDSRRKMVGLPERPEDAVLESLEMLAFPANFGRIISRSNSRLFPAGRDLSSGAPEVNSMWSLAQARAYVRERSADWSQVRPEWGLSGNTSFIIGRRDLTKGLNLAGRVFLHSYDYREDPTTRLLEVLMTGPQVVAQWINMEHYFSAVDNEVYGSGSKVYHNVVGRIGIMSGPWSDLRLGLAWQTVMNGEAPYHEPMRLLTAIEAPRSNIGNLIRRHELLQHFYLNEWVHLVALDPEDGVLYRYQPTGVWGSVDGVQTLASIENERKGVG